MENILFDTLKILEKFNEKLNVLKKEDFEEQKKYIKDFIKDKEKLVHLIENLKKQNYEIFQDDLVHVLVTYTTLVWHFEQMENLIEKIVCAMPNEE
jgi:DNA-binding protein H-NS